MTLHICIYSRHKSIFSELFDNSKFEGYECDGRYSWFVFENDFDVFYFRAICRINCILIVDSYYC